MVARKAPTSETLIDLYVNHKLSTDTIAERYGLHKSLVARHLRKAGVEMRRKGLARPDAKPKPAREVLAAHLADGLTNRQIGDEYNVNMDTARRWLREEGLQREGADEEPPRKGAPPPQISEKRPPKRAAKLGKLTKLVDLRPAQQDKVRESLEGFKEHIALRIERRPP